MHPGDITSATLSFLTDADLLIKNRSCTQVQGQLMITNRIFCDFVMWTKNCLVVQRIHHDVLLWEKLEKSLLPSMLPMHFKK